MNVCIPLPSAYKAFLLLWLRSFILHIDSSDDAEPWPILIEDYQGSKYMPNGAYAFRGLELQPNESFSFICFGIAETDRYARGYLDEW